MKLEEIKVRVNETDQGNVESEGLEVYRVGKLSSAPPNPDALLALAV